MTDIYYLTYNHEDVPFYVGKSKNCYSRLFAHKKTYGKNIKMIKIDKVKNKEWLFLGKILCKSIQIMGF
jgi:predicted GIY-YIG superfamily endonuclease